MQNASYVVIDLTSMPVHVDRVYLPPGKRPVSTHQRERHRAHGAVGFRHAAGSKGSLSERALIRAPGLPVRRCCPRNVTGHVLLRQDAVAARMTRFSVAVACGRVVGIT